MPQGVVVGDAIHGHGVGAGVGDGGDLDDEALVGLFADGGTRVLDIGQGAEVEFWMVFEGAFDNAVVEDQDAVCDGDCLECGVEVAGIECFVFW